MNLAEGAAGATGHEAGGDVKGLAVGLVTQNNDPDGLCRVRVSYPWNDQPRESYWARLVAPMAGKNRGLVLIPEVGDEVLLGFERGDLRFPYVIGALWNGVDKPPLSNSDGNNDKRGFTSRKGHKLLFDDGARGVVELALADGRKLRLDDDSMQLDDGKGNRIKIDSNSGGLTIEAAGKLTIKAASVSIEASAAMELKSSAVMTVTGSLIKLN